MGKVAIRVPMPIKMRVKQFAMFDALKGLTEAIAEKEQRLCMRKELTEDAIGEISNVLKSIHLGDIVKITYYCQYGKEYRQLLGRVNKIDGYWKSLQVGEIEIAFEEIFHISSE